MVRPLAPQGVDQYDDRVRTRLAEIQAAAGVPHAQISMEVLFLQPAGFIRSYEHLFSRALKSDGGESARNEAQAQAGEVGKASGKGAATGGKRFKRSFVVLDEKALQIKTMVDKRLRMMGREIDTLLAGGEVEANSRQCTNCGMFVQHGWRFCPRDGLALSEG